MSQDVSTHPADAGPAGARGGPVEIPLYQVDAFTDRVFWGNPAAVCPLPRWLPDEVMQAIALENNLPETAFLVPAGDGEYHLRWFTPATEVDLCGHATLGAAHVVLHRLRPQANTVVFHSRSGPLTVTREAGGHLRMTFPALSRTAEPDPPKALLDGLLGPRPDEVYRSMDYVVVYANEARLRQVVAESLRLAELDLRGVMITAPGDETDFVSRFFAPKLAIREDPITGSAHCAVVPYWADRLGRDRLTACQYSPRLGETLAIRLLCERRGEHVLLSGSAREYMSGTIRLSAADLVQHRAGQHGQGDQENSGRPDGRTTSRPAADKSR